MDKVSYQCNFHPEELKISGERDRELWSCKRLPDSLPPPHAKQLFPLFSRHA